MTTSERQRANRLYYLSRGLCPGCGGKAYIQPKRVLCIECQQKHDAWQTEARARWKAEGKCTHCGRERDKKGVLCSKCVSVRSNAKAVKQRRERLKALGMCTVCGRTWAEPGHVKCRKCLDRHKAYNAKSNEQAKKRRAARVAAGLCIDCGKPTDREGKQRCSACIEARRDSTRKYQIRKRIEKRAEMARKGVYV